MRIAIFSDTFLPQTNGVVTYITETSILLSARGHKIIIFAPKSKDGGKVVLDNPNIEVITSPSFELPTYKEYKIAIPRVIKDLDIAARFYPDVIHIQSPFSLGLAGLFIAKKLKKPAIATYHTLLPDFIEYYLPIPIFRKGNFLKNIAWQMTKYFYNRCDMVITPSGVMKEVLIKHGIKAPVQVLSNGIDLGIFKPESENARNLMKDRFGLGKTTLIHSGRMSYEKNVQILIKAFARAKKNIDDDVKFLIIGDGPALECLKKTASDLKLGQEVIFTGYMSRKFLLVFLRSSDVFVTASTMETQGIVVLEAMASGLPVIGADKMALPELIKDGFNGYLFKPGDAGMLAEKILKLVKSKETRVKMSINSLNSAKNHSIDITIEKLEKIYSSFAGKSEYDKYKL